MPGEVVGAAWQVVVVDTASAVVAAAASAAVVPALKGASAANVSRFKRAFLKGVHKPF